MKEKITARPRGGRLPLDKAQGNERQLTFEDLGTPLEEVTFVVVDLETTGEAPSAHSITEFGAVKVRGGEVCGEFATLVNPGMPIPPFITVLTGITTAMVLEAPDISSVMPSLLEFLGNSPDTVLVAHNAWFDVGHLKAAAAALDMTWPKVRVLDTVKLARKVFTRDETPNYKLSSLARLCCATTEPTHRALDDARATVDVLHTILARLGPLGVTHLDDLATATDPVPAARRRKAHLADSLPHTPGVYRFIGPSDEILYVGTSVNIYKRVRQYFTAAENRKRIGEMVDLAVRVEATSTATVLEASILELRQIAQFDPPYNRRSRRPERRPWLVLTEEPHPRLAVTRKLSYVQMNHALGPFTSTRGAKAAAELLADWSKLRTCTQRLPAHARPNAVGCHLFSMGKCGAPCLPTGTDTIALSSVRSALGGDNTAIWDSTMNRLRDLGQSERFEQATTERERLRALIAAQKRRDRIYPLLQAQRIVAAQRAGEGWDIALISFGRLMETAHTSSSEVQNTANVLMRTHSDIAAPELACGAAPVEETDILASWLWNVHTRILDFVGERPLALPRHSAARHTLPQPRNNHSPDE
ncbi:DEDD exonuclease domain-containing protein [Arcanobacterium haemolyticum]|nr:DEDD exonuclease domain-containing protein [Arcanobacterium haemolyticum]